jgi:hypothetical protein
MNATNFSGIQPLDVTSTSGFPSSGVVNVTTSSGYGQLSYNGIGTGQLLDCTYLNGTGNITGVGVTIAIEDATFYVTAEQPDEYTGNYLPPLPALVYLGAAQPQALWHMTNCYLDDLSDPLGHHVFCATQGAQIVGNYFLSKHNIGPAFITFGGGNGENLKDFGPDCVITDNVFDIDNVSPYTPYPTAIAQFLFATADFGVIQSFPGTIRDNRLRANGATLPANRSDAGCTFTMGGTTVTDSHCADGDLNSMVGSTYFPVGTSITGVTAGTQFTVSQGALTTELTGVSVTIYNSPGVVDSTGVPILLPTANAVSSMEGPALPPGT